MRFPLLPCPPCCVQAWLLAAEKWEARATKLSARLEVEALDLNASLAKSDGLAVENRMRAALVDSCTKVKDPSSDVTLTKQCVNVSLARDGLTKVCLTLVLQACTLVHIMAVHWQQDPTLPTFPSVRMKYIPHVHWGALALPKISHLCKSKI